MKFSRLLMALCIAGFACDASAEIVNVSQKGRAFEPKIIDIHLNDIIRIHNDDEFTHNVYVMSPDFNFDSDEQDPGHVQDIKFTHAGTYEVHCHIHPKMKLVVNVQ